jgi:hypothetical protein
MYVQTHVDRGSIHVHAGGCKQSIDLEESQEMAARAVYSRD